jgi:hypothetical protein
MMKLDGPSGIGQSAFRASEPDAEMQTKLRTTSTPAFTQALNAVVRAIRAAGPEPMRHEAVQSSVRVLCIFARQDRLQPETFLVELKEMIDGGALESVPYDRRDEVRSDVVRFAINAYYSNER